jgi:hypothetical protein
MTQAAEAAKYLKAHNADDFPGLDRAIRIEFADDSRLYWDDARACWVAEK